MNNNNIEELANKAISILDKMKVLEDALKPLEEEYNAYKVKLEREMAELKLNNFSVDAGKITLIDRINKKLDKKAIMNALGSNDLSEYETEVHSKFIKITPTMKGEK